MTGEGTTSPRPAPALIYGEYRHRPDVSVGRACQRFRKSRGNRPLVISYGRSGGVPGVTHSGILREKTPGRLYCEGELCI